MRHRRRHRSVNNPAPARSAFWQDTGPDQLVSAIAFLARHVERQPHALSALTSAMADGLVATFGPPDLILGILGTVVILQATDLSAESARPVLTAIREIASRRDIEPIAELRRSLTEALTDPDDTFAMSAEEAEQTADRMLGADQSAALNTSARKIMVTSAFG